MNEVTILNIDWPLLLKQKQWLLRQEGGEADGLIHLLDALEDEALDSGIIDESYYVEGEAA